MRRARSWTSTRLVESISGAPSAGTATRSRSRPSWGRACWARRAALRWARPPEERPNNAAPRGWTRWHTWARWAGIRQEVEQLVSNPVSGDIEVREEKVLVGGVRLKVRRAAPRPNRLGFPRWHHRRRRPADRGHPRRPPGEHTQSTAVRVIAQERAQESKRSAQHRRSGSPAGLTFLFQNQRCVDVQIPLGVGSPRLWQGPRQLELLSRRRCELQVFQPIVGRGLEVAE